MSVIQSDVVSIPQLQYRYKRIQAKSLTNEDLANLKKKKLNKDNDTIRTLKESN